MWDDVLNETFSRLREELDDEQRAKLRDMQRAWIASRDKSCAFLLGLFPGHDGEPDERSLHQSRNRDAGTRSCSAFSTTSPKANDRLRCSAVEAKGFKIPIIGLGTWTLRGRDCARLVEQAIRIGYRHIDTAQMYDNEREVGEGVRASGQRSEVMVTTKVQP